MLPAERLSSSILTLPTMLCQLFNACGRTSSGPSFIEPGMANFTAIKGTDAEFVCNIKNLGRNMVAFLRADDPPRLIAYDGKVFRQRHKYAVYSRANNEQWKLVIRNANERDGGDYMCQVNTNPMISKVAHLNLLVPPRVDRNTASVVEVREGRNVTLSCNAHGVPPPSVIWRRHDSGLIRFNGITGYGSTVSNGSKLALTKVSRKHMNEYVCVASNGVLPDESWTVKLQITFPPTVIPQTIRIGATRKGHAVLVCNAEAWPRPRYFWAKNGVAIVKSSNKYDINEEVGDSYGSRISLTVTDLEESDFGVYTCAAKNDQGSHEAQIELFEGDPSENVIPEEAIVLEEIDNRSSSHFNDIVYQSDSNNEIMVAGKVEQPSNVGSNSIRRIQNAKLQTITYVLFLMIMFCKRV